MASRTHKQVLAAKRLGRIARICSKKHGKAAKKACFRDHRKSK